MNEANTSKKIQICIFYLALLQCSNLGTDSTVELRMLFKNLVRRTKPKSDISATVCVNKRDARGKESLKQKKYLCITQT